MPRIPGTGVYEQPAPDVLTATIIESTVYNSFVNDVETDLNLPRPVVAGGTGASNATQARDNLDVEVAGQTVTNYNTHVWENGSFISTEGATGGPLGTSGVWSGICHMVNPDHINLELRQYGAGDTAPKYYRQKSGGVWGAWSSTSALGADLGISKSNPYLVLNSTDNTGRGVTGTAIGVLHWMIQMGDGGAGDNFLIARHNDAGAITGTPFSIIRSTGVVSVANGMNSAGIVAVSAEDGLRNTVTAGKFSRTIYTVTGTRAWSVGVHPDGRYLVTDETAAAPRFAIDLSGTATFAGALSAAGSLVTNGELTVAGGAINLRATPAGNAAVNLQDQTAANRGIVYWSRTGDLLVISHSGGVNPISMEASGKIRLGAGFFNRPGTGGVGGGYTHNFNFTGSIEAWVDTSNFGNIAFTSDYRTKKDVVDLDSMWDTVKALRPIRYTQAQYTPQIEIERRIKEAAAEKERAVKDGVEPKPAEQVKPMFEADDIERWGFVAHELQETMIDSAASGYKDAPDYVQSPNPFTLIAALTRALQEAMARIEALEAAQATP